MNLISRQNVSTLDPTSPASQTATDKQTDATASLEHPLVVIEASNSFAALKLRDIWIYRELLYFMVWRDLKVRYKQTALGVLWVILQPLLMTLVFTSVLGRLVRLSS